MEVSTVDRDRDIMVSIRNFKPETRPQPVILIVGEAKNCSKVRARGGGGFVGC